MTQKKTIIDVLTMDELETIENLVGKGFAEIFDAKGMSSRATYALHWVLAKRANPDAKIEDSKKLTLGQINQALTEAVDDPKA